MIKNLIIFINLNLNQELNKYLVQENSDHQRVENNQLRREEILILSKNIKRGYQTSLKQ
jgi:hypothetical protein